MTRKISRRFPRLVACAGGLLIVALLAAAWWQRQRLPAAWNLVDGDIRQGLAKTIFQVAGQPVRILFLIKALLFLLFLHLLSRTARLVISYWIRRSPRFGQQDEFLFSRGASFLVYSAGLVIGIIVEQINLGALVVVFGTLGVGIGFGLQPLVSNFVAGMILLIEQPIRLGDRIEFGDRTGEVVRVGIRASWIRTYDNAILVVPNSEFTTRQILNWTVSDPKIRLAVSVQAAYDSDTQQIMRILLEVAERHSAIMKDPAPSVILSELGTQAITLTLFVWTISAADNFAQLRSEIYLQILSRFREAGIEIPFPQFGLRMKPREAAVLAH
jgi:small-conductance mechanosensitive channel